MGFHIYSENLNILHFAEFTRKSVFSVFLYIAALMLNALIDCMCVVREVSAVTIKMQQHEIYHLNHDISLD